MMSIKNPQNLEKRVKDPKGPGLVPQEVEANVLALGQGQGVV